MLQPTAGNCYQHPRLDASNATGYTAAHQHPNATLTYREPLPDDCPPDTADEITSPSLVYRLARAYPPTEDDSRSQRAERPDRAFRNINECQARSLSVRTNLVSAMELMGLRPMRGRMLCQVQLDHGAGHMMQTGEDPHRSTWWPLADYDIMANCPLVTT